MKQQQRDVQLNNAYEVSSYVSENTVFVQQKLVNVVYG